MDAYEAIVSRRSIRRFDGRPVPRELIDKLLYAACLAPAPHHTRPWHFVVLETPGSRGRVADAMGTAWRHDLERDGGAPARTDARLARSRRRIEEAPALVLGCIVSEGLPARPAGGRAWPDERRRRAEWSMAVQSMGCALANIMVAAHAEGLASYWMSAPLFCAEAVREALELPAEFEAQALVAIGYAAGGYSPRARPAPALAALTQRR